MICFTKVMCPVSSAKNARSRACRNIVAEASGGSGVPHVLELSKRGEGAWGSPPYATIKYSRGRLHPDHFFFYLSDNFHNSCCM